jgi:membrane peptidoglycan carboxypeptidase
VKVFWFSLKLVLTIAVGASALAGSVALLAPAGSTLAKVATPLGALDVTINAPAARSIVYDRFGNVMGSLSAEDRAPVKLKDVPKVLVNAVLSIEDRNFFEHHGVDWGGTARALFKNVDSGSIGQGGSTITQQLVKNTLSTTRQRDLKTKAREAILAIRLEHEISKNRILEDYLNLVYFGNRAYGVRAAAERYFTSPLVPNPLKKITLPQAALLAGLIQSPEALNPIKHPDRAARRRSEVLDAMVSNHKVTRKAAEAAKAVPLPTRVSYPFSSPLDYYKDEVRNRLLIDDPNIPNEPSEILGSTTQTRANAVLRGGLKIYTAYDPYVQLAAQSAINDVLPKSEFTASLVAIDNSDGGVRAIANGQTFAESQFDPATEGLGRQAGSAFKVFTLAAALSRGYTPNDSVSGSSINWRTGPNSFYHLSGDCHGGTPSLSRALAISDNCAWVRTELSLGPGNYGADGAQRVIEMAKAMGIDTSRFDPVVSTTLGTNGVHPLEMAQAYSVFPNDGVLKRATFITKIVNARGRVLYQSAAVGNRVLDANVARTEIEMMKGVVKNGTASNTLGSMRHPAAGKTGTTDKSVDAWFVGFTPQFTAAVWMGNPEGEVAWSLGTVFGGTYPARIWRAFMERATADLPALDFPPPDTALLPRSSYINEFGRRFVFRYSGSRGTTPSTFAAPAPTTVVTPPTLDAGPTPTTRPTPPTTGGSPPTTGAGP